VGSSDRINVYEIQYKSYIVIFSSVLLIAFGLSGNLILTIFLANEAVSELLAKILNILLSLTPLGFLLLWPLGGYFLVKGAREEKKK